jgi:LPS-assembly protein
MGDYQAIEHALRPEVIYEYVPEVSQTNLPSFDKLDRNQAHHDLRFGFSTFLTTKEVKMDAENNPVTSYREMARLQILQQYNIEQPPLDEQYNPDPKSGFADLSFRLDVMPKSYLGLTYNAIMLPDEGRAKQHDVFVSLDSGQGQLFRVGYQYRSDFPVDEVITEVGLKVLPSISLNTYHDYSVKNKELFSQGYGIRYIRGCWGIGFTYERENDDNRFLVSINLLGLGSIGSGQPLGSMGAWNRTW